MSGETWIIKMGDGFHFDVACLRDGDVDRQDAMLNGRYPTKLAALEQVIEDLEGDRQSLNEQIRRAKRMRARELRKAKP